MHFFSFLIILMEAGILQVQVVKISEHIETKRPRSTTAA
jgi:hypothetical protein